MSVRFYWMTKKERIEKKKRMFECLRLASKLYPHAEDLLKEACKINRFALQGRSRRRLMAAAIYLSGRLRGESLTQRESADIVQCTEVTVRTTYHKLVAILGEDYDPDLRVEIESLVYACKYIKLTSNDPSVRERVSRMIDVDLPKIGKDKHERLLERVIELLV